MRAGETTPQSRASQGRNTTADHTVDVLLLFDDTRPVLSAADVSRLLGMTRSTTYRYLQTLRSYGLVEEQEQRGNYRLGPRVFQLARVARRGLALPEIALPFMRDLMAKTGEVVLLTRRWGDLAVCVERVDSEHAVRLSYERGTTHAAHAGASAKILLAFAEDEDVDDVLSRGPLRRYTERTVVDPDTLRTQLHQVRAQGYCVTASEMEEGIRAVAAPVFRPDGRLAASLSVAAPVFRLTDDLIPGLIETVRATAAAITARYREIDG